MGQVIAVVSGKGGTGKTSFTANVGMALAQMGHPTLCLDCDVGLRNLDIALAMTDRAVMDFTDVMYGRCSLEEAAVRHPGEKKLYLLTARRGPERRRSAGRASRGCSRKSRSGLTTVWWTRRRGWDGDFSWPWRERTGRWW